MYDPSTNPTQILDPTVQQAAAQPWGQQYASQASPAAPAPQPQPQPQAPFQAAPPQEPRRRNTAAFVGLGAVIALLLLAGGIALFGPFRSVSTTQASAADSLPSSRGAQSAPDISEVPSSIEIPAELGEDAPVTLPDVPSVPAGNAPSNPGGSGGGAPQPTNPPAPSTPAPVITSFMTPESIDCHNGNFQTFTASWSTSHAVKVTISIDGPGVYKTYGPTGSDSFPFDCSTPHTFLLTAYGQDGSTVSRSITLHPRNVQMPESGDADADQDAQGASTPDDEL